MFSGFEKTDRAKGEGVCVSAATKGRRKNESLQACQLIYSKEFGIMELVRETCQRCMFLGLILCGPLAQLVEHLTLNQGVTGSIPVRLTILLREWRNWQTR